MRDKGLDPDNDPATRTDFVRRVTLQLNDMRRKGKAEKIGRGRALGGSDISKGSASRRIAASIQ
jgi:hypothetical protein